METQQGPLVVKLGGAEGVRHDHALRDIAELARQGVQVIVVHGGSAEANRLGLDVGHPAAVLTSPSGHESRHTDPRTLEVFVMATALVNRRLVGALQADGINAFGLSGLDGASIRGTRKSAIRSVENGRVRVVRDDWSGRIESVDSAPLRSLLRAGLTPVMAPLAMTAEGQPLNVDGDRVASAVASALRADALVLLTGANGLYASFPDEGTRIACASMEHVDELIGYAEGRMKRKVLAANEALEGGVGRVAIAAASSPAPVVDALRGSGTTLYASEAEMTAQVVR
ncbi:MAG: [LysW]-aminoadipate kinase [Planctomycetota bacterium]